MLKKKIKVILLFLILIIIGIIVFLLYPKKTIIDKETTYYVSSNKNKVDLYDKDLNKSGEIVRGQELKIKDSKFKKEEDHVIIQIDKKDYYILKDNLVKEIIDIVSEKELYVRTSATLYENLDESKINGLALKGEKLDVIGYDKILEDGSVNAYKIKKEEKESYIYKKYIVYTSEESLLNYEPEKYYNIHNSRKDTYSGVGGNGGSLDYYPVLKPKFENNIMPEKVNAFYLNSGSFIMKNIDKYIEYAKKTKINAFVVDIKDNESPGYKSKVFEELSPTNYKYANNSLENYKIAIKKLNDAGFYTIGRITVFKDKYFVQDNPDVAILNKRTNSPFDSGRWPSAFNRKIWEFNIKLAKEAVNEMGFNEIQFDYVRFPDRIVRQEKNGELDFRNIYNEEKVQAIQRFLMYACDELHKLNVYVSADVFGESVNSYITAYGQYWPAISNVVDVISGMPYPDHFAPNSYGIAKPGENPYGVMFNWAKEAYKKQQEIPTPAVARTWILAQNTMQGFEYNSEHISAQIKALYDANLTGGYMTWASSSNLQGYINRNAAYIKEY